MNYYNNPVVAQLPKHLLKFIVPQYYDRYTSIDQAVWRYVMRQNYAYLRDIAYYPYIPGLTKAGLTIESVPDLQSHERCFKRLAEALDTSMALFRLPHLWSFRPIGYW